MKVSELKKLLKKTVAFYFDREPIMKYGKTPMAIFLLFLDIILKRYQRGQQMQY